MDNQPTGLAPNAGVEAPVNPFLKALSDTRAMLESAAQAVKQLKDYPELKSEAADAGEVIANIQIAYRHLEDAKMRVGKAVQAFKGGRSIYDEAPAAKP